jgi:hypothetical protein
MEIGITILYPDDGRRPYFTDGRRLIRGRFGEGINLPPDSPCTSGCSSGREKPVYAVRRRRGIRLKPLAVVHAVAPDGWRSGERGSIPAIGQHSNGCRVSVCSVVAPVAEDLPLHQALVAGGVPVTPWSFPAAISRELRQIAEVLRRAAPEIVHTHGYRSDRSPRRRAEARVKIAQCVHVHRGDWKNLISERLQSRPSDGSTPCWHRPAPAHDVVCHESGST